MTSYSIFLRDQHAEATVDAELIDAIDDTHLRLFEATWRPQVHAYNKEMIATGQAHLVEQSGHWDWRSKMERSDGLLAYQSYALMCDGQLQGLMRVDTSRTCRLPEQAGKHLVYVNYLETAPWNRPRMTPTPKYRGVGVTMIRTAIEVSLDLEFEGRIGLHSLPQAVEFYGKKCRMTDLGEDSKVQNLNYFELAADQARMLLNVGKI